MGITMHDEETLPVEASQDAPEVTEESSTPEAETAQPEAPEDKKSKGVQKRIDELTANWRNEQREKEWLRQQYEMLQKQVQTAKPEPVEQSKAAPSDRPKIEEFEDVNDYVEAVTEWKLSQAEKAKSEAAKREAEQRQQQELQGRVTSMVEGARQKYADFDEVVLSNPSLVISQFAAEALAGMANGADVAYHLGKTPAEAARIAQLPQPLQLVELGQIAATLKLSEKKVTQAPAPVSSQIGGASGGGEPEDIKAWMEWRRNQLSNRR